MTKIKDIIIIGSGGLGREVLWLISRINNKKKEWNVLGFLDDTKEIGTIVNGYKVLGNVETASNYPNAYLICAVGASNGRKCIIERIEKICPNAKFATLIDPSVIISDLVKIEDGTIICAGAVITVDIIIERFVVISANCTVGHDAILKDFVTLYPNVNVSGNTFIDKFSELGTGTQIIQKKKIGTNTIVGAGSVVVRDLPDNCVCVGVPAKPIRYL